MKIDDLIVDVGKQLQVKRDVLETLKKHAQDPEKSARLAFGLIEIGIDAFRAAGMGPFVVMALCQLIAHGATTETALAALMRVQEEDELKKTIDKHIDPEGAAREEEEAARLKKQRVM